MTGVTAWQWMTAAGLLSMYHPSWPSPDSQHYYGAPFADTVHNTSLFLTEQYFNGYIPKSRLYEYAVKIVDSIWDERGFFKRYPGSNEQLNRDQTQMLVPILREVGLHYEADRMTKLHAGFLLPHWYNHYYFRNTWAGRIFEMGDSISDWWSGSESSIVKNMYRLAWAEHRGVGNKCAVKLLNEKVDVIRAMEIFGSRWSWTGDHEYPELPREPGPTTPPPIYKGWDIIWKSL